MRVGLVTTSINIPTAFAAYRAIDTDVRIFIAMDLKTPEASYKFCDELGNCEVLPPVVSKYECDALIGQNTDSRRNIALLAALEWGAELLISVDDDMLVQNTKFFAEFECLFEEPFTGLQLGAANQWFDAGQFTIPPAKQRGLPFDTTFAMAAESVVDAKIGVAQGIILGIPDTDATTAIANHPFVHSATDILRNGFVVHPHAHAVFNSQLTAFRRELAPAFAQFYNHQGRNTDIMASVLMRRVMQERNLYTYYGPPMALHARRPRPLFNDLKAEMYGLEHIAEYADYLRRAPLPDGSVVDQCRVLSEGWNGPELQAAKAWYNDVERALG